MAEFRLYNNELLNSSGRMIARIYNDEILNDSGRRVARVYNDEILDDSGRRIAKISDVKNEIEGANYLDPKFATALWIGFIKRGL